MIGPLVIGGLALALHRIGQSGQTVGADTMPEDDAENGVAYDAGEDPEVLAMLAEGDEPTPAPLSDAPGKVVISTMALSTLPGDWAGWTLREWAGTPQASGHPGWSDLAASKRNKAGRVLPTLLREWRLDPDSIVVCVGFSAGSNSGLRELLRNADDRAQIAAAVALDGAHWNVKATSDNPPKSAYWDWAGEAGPFEAMALSGKPFVATASAVGRPGQKLTMTREGLRSIGSALEAAGIPKTAAPAEWTRALTGTASGQTITRAPVESWRQGGFVVALYDGARPADHVWQAGAVARNALEWVRAQGIT